jgi:glycine betaine catabolism A
MTAPGVDVTEALKPFGESRMLPAAAYTSAQVFGWEQRELFAGSWTCLGRVVENFAGTTSQRGFTAGDVPVLVTRDGDGRLHAFADTCRHRGHELLGATGCSARRSITCPYHGWTYALDGSLHNAPRFADVDGFDPAEFGLVRLPVETWHGWLFVNATGNGPAFADHLGELDSLVATYDPASLVVAARHDYEIAANWKVVTENYHECYHCPLIHPELCKVSPPTSGDNYDLPGAWVGGSMELRDHAVTMSLSGASDGVPIAGAPAGEVRYLGLLPNLLVSLHPDYVMTHRIEPLAPDRTRIECEWLFPPAAVERPGFDPSYAVDFWDLTNRQDWAACESVQRGLSSPHYRPGVLAPSEDAVYAFVHKVATAYSGSLHPWI